MTTTAPASENAAAPPITAHLDAGTERLDDKLGFIDQPVGKKRDRSITLRQHEE